MNSKVLSRFKELNQNIPEQLYQLMDMPDDKFDAVADNFIKVIKETYSNPETRNSIISELKTAPAINIEEERKGIKELLSELEEDDSLSAKKKEVLSTMINCSLEIIESIYILPRNMVEVKITLDEGAAMPSYAHSADSGADICAIEKTTISPHSTVVVKTGVHVSIPVGYEIQVRPRSGLSLKTPLRICNTPGTIDSGYTGEIGVIMENTSNLTQTIEEGQKIAQLVLVEVPMIKWSLVDSLENTERGSGGYGSTDKK